MKHLIEEGLARNPHYRDCRRLGQLGPVRLFRASGPMFPVYVERCREAGQRVGDIKPLSLTRREGWSGVFPGAYFGIDVAASEPPFAVGARS